MTERLSAIGYQLSVSARPFSDAIKPSPYVGRGLGEGKTLGASAASLVIRSAGRRLTPPASSMLWPPGYTVVANNPEELHRPSPSTERDARQRGSGLTVALATQPSGVESSRTKF